MVFSIFYSFKHMRMSNMNHTKKVSRAYLASRLIWICAFFVDGQSYLRIVCNEKKQEINDYKVRTTRLLG